jgi:hypothetical protein
VVCLPCRFHWFFRTLAVSSHEADTIEKAVRLAKLIGTSLPGAFLSTISQRA